MVLTAATWCFKGTARCIENLCSTLLKGKEQLLYLANGHLSHLTVITRLTIHREEGLASGYGDSRDVNCALYHCRYPIHTTYEPPKLQKYPVLWLSSLWKTEPITASWASGTLPAERAWWCFPVLPDCSCIERSARGWSIHALLGWPR